MNFENIRLQPHDPYLDKWIATLIPLVNKRDTFERFIETNESRVQKTEDKGQKRGFSLFERLIKKLWLPRTLQTYERLGKPWGVIISDTMLKFHNQDVRREYADTQL